MTLSTLTGGFVFLLARLLFGGILAFMGLNHFFEREQLVGYAAAKGVPAAGIAVPLSGLVLLAGGVGIVVGALPVVAAGGIALFLAVTTPLMHDFWTVEDPQQRQQELTQFLKNAALLGGALLLVAVGGADWPFAVGL